MVRCGPGATSPAIHVSRTQGFHVVYHLDGRKAWYVSRDLQAVSATDFPFSGSSYHSYYRSGFFCISSCIGYFCLNHSILFLITSI